MTQAPADPTHAADTVLPAPTELAAAAGPVDPAKVAGGIEAILFSTDRPVQAIRLASALGLVSEVDEAPAEAAAVEVAGPGQASEADAGAGTSPVVETPKARKSRKKAGPASDAAAARARAIETIRGGVAHLNTVYQESGRSFRIESLAGGYRVMTLPEYSGAIAAFQGARARTSLSPAALEALAIVSYKQPITRARLEAIRGVACGEILRSLMERRLVTIVGRAEELGRPMLYGTTGRFLELFGLSSLKDLPTAEELRSKN